MRSPAGSATCNDIDGDSPSITFDGAHMTGTRKRTTGPLRLETIEDNTVEADETVTLQLGGGTPKTMTITPAPDSVEVSFALPSFSAAEDAGLFQPVFNLDNAPGRDLVIPLIFTDMTATSGADYTPVASATIPATGSDRSTFDIPVIDDKVQEEDETFTVAIDEARLPAGVTVGSRSLATFTITDNDPLQIVLSQEHFTVIEPEDARCLDSHVGDEKIFTDITLRDGAAGVRTVRDYGPVLTSVQYKVQLANSPGPGKVVSVEIWEPTDLDRPDVRRFHENARIHGIGWPPIRQGRISIDNSPVLNQGQPVGDGSRRHLKHVPDLHQQELGPAEDGDGEHPLRAA